MKPLFILLTQTTTGAVITIIALLLVAAIIGYLTAWYYAKSVYTPVIKGLEADKAELIKQVAGLKDDIAKLTKVDLDQMNPKKTQGSRDIDTIEIYERVKICNS